MAHVVISVAEKAMFWRAHPALSAWHRDSGQSHSQNAKVRLSRLENIFLSVCNALKSYLWESRFNSINIQHWFSVQDSIMASPEVSSWQDTSSCQLKGVYYADLLQANVCAISCAFSCDLPCFQNTCSWLSELPSPQVQMILNIQCTFTSTNSRVKDREGVYVSTISFSLFQLYSVNRWNLLRKALWIAYMVLGTSHITRPATSAA